MAKLKDIPFGSEMPSFDSEGYITLSSGLKDSSGNTIITMASGSAFFDGEACYAGAACAACCACCACEACCACCASDANYASYAGNTDLAGYACCASYAEQAGGAYDASNASCAGYACCAGNACYASEACCAYFASSACEACCACHALDAGFAGDALYLSYCDLHLQPSYCASFSAYLLV